MAGLSVTGVAEIWQKLRRGKIVQWGLAYSATSWILLQGLDYATSTFHWPPSLQQHATLVLLLGLPVALVLAWYHGDRGVQNVQRMELALIALLIMTGGAVLWRYQPANEATGEGRAPTPPGPAGLSMDAPAATGARPFVAVLPFANPGVSADDRAFADGLQSDILGELSRNHSLDVVAARSVERFRDNPVSAVEAGQKVGATHVLQGSLQRSGNRMWIKARLVDARTSAELWAEDFDREITAARLFTIRGDIVLAVADALQAGLTDVERSNAGAALTQNIDAWAMEKTARALLESRSTESIVAAEELFRQVIALDPDYARAYAGLADAVWLKADYANLPWPPALAEAERLLNHALRLDPDLVEALTTRAKLAQESFDYTTAEAAYRRVFELNPSYARAYHWYAQLLYQEGREIEAVDAMVRAVNLDPMSLSLRLNMGLALLRPGDPSDALVWMEKAREIDPASPAWRWGKSVAFGFAGRFDEALHWQRAMLELDPESAPSMVAVAEWQLELGDLDGARAWLAHARQDGRDVERLASLAGLLALYAGDSVEALDHARHALALDPYDIPGFMVLDAVLLRRGDPSAVASAVQSSFLQLGGPGVPPIRAGSVLPATDLALALRLGGDAERAEELLDAVLDFVAVARQNDALEHLIHEVRATAIRGDKDVALRTLHELIEGGWRGPYWQFYRHHDPVLDGLREEPRFQEAFAVVELDVRSQREQAKRNGDLDVPTL